jgi:hypothetical protein
LHHNFVHHFCLPIYLGANWYRVLQVHSFPQCCPKIAHKYGISIIYNWCR